MALRLTVLILVLLAQSGDAPKLDGSALLAHDIVMNRSDAQFKRA